MKTTLKTKLMIIALMAGSQAYAQTSGSHGGDECERKFKEIAYDLSSWIQRGGPKALSFKTGETSTTYSEKMKTQIDELVLGKKLLIECTSERLLVNEIEKTCRWHEKGAETHVQCNYNRFMAGVGNEDSSKKLRLEDAQYRMVHHELAGIAGLEKNEQANSTYYYSDQIVGSLEDQVVRKLAVKKPVVDIKEDCTGYQRRDGDQSYSFCRESYQGNVIRNPKMNGMPMLYQSNSAFPDVLCKAFGFQKSIATESSRSVQAAHEDIAGYFVGKRMRVLVWEGQDDFKQVKMTKRNINDGNLKMSGTFVYYYMGNGGYRRLSSVSCSL